MNTFQKPFTTKRTPCSCITLIGMAAAGKTTIGRELAHLLGWAHMDADNLIEAVYGTRLHNIASYFPKKDFLDVEAEIISNIRVTRTVISTGGSAVYREKAMAALRLLGPIVYLAVPLPIILERIARKPERGLAIAPGQTIEDLYNERIALYNAAATHTIQAGNGQALSYAQEIVRWLTALEQ